VGQKLSRRELYDLVWSEPVSKIAPRYNISDVGFSKLCRRVDVPLPPRGYWVKLQHGKTVKKPPLKAAENPKDEVVVIADRPQVDLPDLPSDIAEAIERETHADSRITVPVTVSKWHPIVEKWFDDEQRRRSTWPGASRQRPKITALERRRRTLLSVFFRALERRGWSVTAELGGKLTATVFGQSIKFGVMEVVKQRRVPLTPDERRSAYSYRDYNFEHDSTGLLRLRLYKYYGSTRDWLDTTERPLETRLNDVIVGMLQEAAQDRAREERWAEERRQRQHEEQLRLEAAERIRREKEQVDKLVADAGRWETSNRIRAYVKHAREIGRAPSKSDDGIEEWSAWAWAIADRIDPMVS